jgi:hypothetical protein
MLACKSVVIGYSRSGRSSGTFGETTMNKDAFHIAKLSLFNMRLLRDIETASTWHSDIGALKSRRCRLDSVSEPVSLFHQSAYLGHAYVCLVWLRETVKKDTAAEAQYIETLPKRFDFSLVEKVSGPRDISAPKEKLRLIRNAISHARVTFDDDKFLFSDEAPNENTETVASLSWSGVGMLADASLFTVNDLIYSPNNTSDGIRQPADGLPKPSM